MKLLTLKDKYFVRKGRYVVKCQNLKLNKLNIQKEPHIKRILHF